MSGQALVPAVATMLVVLAIAGAADAWTVRGAARGRTRALRGGPAPDRAVPFGSAAGAVTGSAARALGAVGAGLAVAVVTASGGALFAAAAALVAAVAAWTTFTRLEPASRRRAARRVVAELPAAVDLFAAALAAGAPVDRALGTAGVAVGGEVGDAFVRGAAALGLGRAPAVVVAQWAADPVLRPLEPFGRTLVRGHTGGTELVPLTARFADELRAARRHEAEAIARKVAVRATVPLGVCFLPAFVLLGIVPAVLAGARTLGI